MFTLKVWDSCTWLVVWARRLKHAFCKKSFFTCGSVDVCFYVGRFINSLKGFRDFPNCNVKRSEFESKYIECMRTWLQQKIDGMLFSWENAQVCVFGCYFSCTEAKKEDMDLRLIGQAMERSADSRQRRWAQRSPCRGRKPNLGCHWMDCELAPPSFLLSQGLSKHWGYTLKIPQHGNFHPQMIWWNSNGLGARPIFEQTRITFLVSHSIPPYPHHGWFEFLALSCLTILYSYLLYLFLVKSYSKSIYKCPILWETIGNLLVFQGSQAEHGEIPPLHPLRCWRVPRAAELGGRNQSDLWALSVQPASDLSQAGIGRREGRWCNWNILEPGVQK